MSVKSVATMATEKVLLQAICRAIAPYLQHMPWHVTPLPMFNVYWRCHEDDALNLWSREPVTQRAVCASGATPYPMAEDYIGQRLMFMVAACIRVELFRAVEWFQEAVPGRVCHSVPVVVEGVGVFYSAQCSARRWRNPKDGRVYDLPAAMEIRFRRFSNSTWAAG